MNSTLYIAPFLQYSMSVIQGRTRTANIDAPELSPYGTQLKLPRNCTPVKHYMLEIPEPVEIVQCSIGLYKEIIHDPKILIGVLTWADQIPRTWLLPMTNLSLCTG